MTHSELSNKFIKMEQEYNLLECSIDDVCIWKIIRILVYNMINSCVFGVESTHPNMSYGDSIIKKCRELYLRHKYSGFKNCRQSDNVVIRHRRRILVDGKYVEVNTEYLDEIIDGINSSNTEYIEFGFSYLNRNINSTTKLVTTNPALVIINKYKYKYLWNKSIRNIEEKIQDAIRAYFHIEVDIKRLIINHLSWFHEGYRVYKRFFSITKPENVYLVCSYGKEYIIKAAHDIGAVVTEIQHGIIGPDHMAYEFPYNHEVQCFPDYFLAYGQYWKDIVHFPLDDEKIIVKGNPYYSHQVKRYIEVERDKKCILFISSGRYGKKMSETACEVLKDLSDYRVIYKLHPSEFGVWRSLYTDLDNLLKNKEYTGHIRVVEDELPLYKLFAIANYIVGVNSTALYESIVFDPVIILMGFDSLDNMKTMIQKYELPVLNDSAELINYMKENSGSEKLDDSEYFYKMC